MKPASIDRKEQLHFATINSYLRKKKVADFFTNFNCKYLWSYIHIGSDRSSRPEVFCKKGILKGFTKFTGKHLRWSLFFNEVAGLRRNFAKFLKHFFFLIEHPWWLLLKLYAERK